MSTEPPLEEQIAIAGLTYGRRHDISYRTGLVMMFGALVCGAIFLARHRDSPVLTLPEDQA